MIYRHHVSRKLPRQGHLLRDPILYHVLVGLELGLIPLAVINPVVQHSPLGTCLLLLLTLLVPGTDKDDGLRQERRRGDD